MLGISRGSAYRAIREGALPTIKIGRRALILREAFLRLLKDGSASGETSSSPDQRGVTP
jgi:excisionase family DNA binding protein